MNGKSKSIAILLAAALLVVGVFVGGIKLLGGGVTTSTPVVAAPVVVNCIGGSEKTALVGDPQVQRILQDKYKITVSYTPMGSYDQVTLSKDELAARNVDCLWPSSVSAQYVFEATHKTSSFDVYKAETVLQSPIVIYAGPTGADALVKAGITVKKTGNQYFLVDLKKLMVEYIAAKKNWKGLTGGALEGPVQISSTDPAKSNSGFTLYQLMLTMLATPDVYQAPSIEQARSKLALIHDIYESQGLQARSSDQGFQAWILQGGESHAPLYAGYESQIISAVQDNRSNADALGLLTKNIKILYPEPTVYSDHPVLALDAKAKAFVEALKDPQIQTIAWKKYGFRSGTQIGLNKVSDFPELGLASDIKTSQLPNAEVTQALLGCLRTGACS